MLAAANRVESVQDLRILINHKLFLVTKYDYKLCRKHFQLYTSKLRKLSTLYSIIPLH